MVIIQQPFRDVSVSDNSWNVLFSYNFSGFCCPRRFAGLYLIFLCKVTAFANGKNRILNRPRLNDNFPQITDLGISLILRSVFLALLLLFAVMDCT